MSPEHILSQIIESSRVKFRGPILSAIFDSWQLRGGRGSVYLSEIRQALAGSILKPTLIANLRKLAGLGVIGFDGTLITVNAEQIEAIGQYLRPAMPKTNAKPLDLAAELRKAQAEIEALRGQLVALAIENQKLSLKLIRFERANITA